MNGQELLDCLQLHHDAIVDEQIDLEIGSDSLSLVFDGTGRCRSNGMPRNPSSIARHSSYTLSSSPGPNLR